MTDPLSTKKCKPCEGGVAPLTATQAKQLLQQLPKWQLTSDGRWIFKDFEFKNFYRTMAFVNAVAWVANQEDHHPDMEVGYKHCMVRFTTHAISGLSENDLICAAKIGQLFDETP